MDSWQFTSVKTIINNIILQKYQTFIKQGTAGATQHPTNPFGHGPIFTRVQRAFGWHQPFLRGSSSRGQDRLMPDSATLVSFQWGAWVPGFYPEKVICPSSGIRT